MQRRSFLKNTLLGSAGATGIIAASGTDAQATKGNEKYPGSPSLDAVRNKKRVIKNWIWMHTRTSDTVESLQTQFRLFKESGITGLLISGYSEKHYGEAKAAGLEAHCWNWTMNKNDKALLQAHPEWYAISRDGKSCADHPPYVGYYRWLCPSKPEVQQYLKEDAERILGQKYVDGIHLDYVRYCDIILPLNLWKQYNIEQQKELPQYDYCYCDTCKNAFREKTGKDISALPFPDASLSWRQFRYDAITHIVNEIAGVAKSHHKKITAAVFPTPEVARRNVRQDWTNWNLDAVFPMTYHKFYQEEVSWIGDAVREGVHFLNDRFPLYAGLYLPDFSGNLQEISNAIHLAIQQQAKGISFFGDVQPAVLELIKNIFKEKYSD